MEQVLGKGARRGPPTPLRPKNHGTAIRSICAHTHTHTNSPIWDARIQSESIRAPCVQLICAERRSREIGAERRDAICDVAQLVFQGNYRSASPSGSTLAEIGAELAAFGPNLLDAGPSLVICCRCRPKFGRDRAKLGRSGPSSVEVGRCEFILVDVGAMLVEVGPMLAILGQHWSNLADIWQHIGRSRAASGRFRANAQLSSNSGKILHRSMFVFRTLAVDRQTNLADLRATALRAGESPSTVKVASSCADRPAAPSPTRDSQRGGGEPEEKDPRDVPKPDAGANIVSTATSDEANWNNAGLPFIGPPTNFFKTSPASPNTRAEATHPCHLTHWCEPARIP